MNQHITSYLKTLKSSSLERKVPNISEWNAEFLKNIIRERQPKHLLEIGTANGYSTLQFALALNLPRERSAEERGGGLAVSENPEYQSSVSPAASQLLSQGALRTITTIEYAWNAHIEAVEHFRNCKVKNIHAIWWDAKAVIPTLADSYFDFIFIDAMKREYLDYLLLVLPKCTPDAIIIIDDVEKFRDKMEPLYDWLTERKISYTLEKTDEDDSIMILLRESFL